MKRTVVLLVLLASAPAASALTPVSPEPINVVDGSLTRFGAWTPKKKSLSEAITKLGKPARISSRCRVHWRKASDRPALDALSTSFAGGPTDCKAFPVQVIGTSSQGWQTNQGLAVGATVAAMREDYPKAKKIKKIGPNTAGYLYKKGTPYQLDSSDFLGPGQETPTLIAIVRNGKVAGIEVFTFFAGD